MKKAVFSSVLFVVALSVGCRYCCTPYDNCGPVFANPHNCEWNYRSGSAFNQEAIPAEGQMVDGQVIMDGQTVDGQVMDGQVIMDGQTVDGQAMDGQVISAPAENTIMEGEVIEPSPATPVPAGSLVPGNTPVNQAVPGTVVPDGAALPTNGYMVYKKFNGV